MEIRNKRELKTLLFLLILLMQPISMLFNVRERDLVFYVIWVVFIGGVFLIVYIFRKNIAPYVYKSDNSEIYIRGCKTGYYDPDFISVENISNVSEFGKNRIVVELKNNDRIELKLSRKYRDTVLEDIKSRIGL